MSKSSLKRGQGWVATLEGIGSASLVSPGPTARRGTLTNSCCPQTQHPHPVCPQAPAAPLLQPLATPVPAPCMAWQPSSDHLVTRAAAASPQAVSLHHHWPARPCPRPRHAHHRPFRGTSPYPLGPLGCVGASRPTSWAWAPVRGWTGMEAGVAGGPKLSWSS